MHFKSLGDRLTTMFYETFSFDAYFSRSQLQAQLFPSSRNRRVFSGKMPCQKQYYPLHFLDHETIEFESTKYRSEY